MPDSGRDRKAEAYCGSRHEIHIAAGDVRLGVGYDNASDYDPYIRTDVTSSMQNRNTSVYLRVPFDLFGTPTPSRGTVTVRPLIRDGGQRLAVERPLWEVTREGRREAWLRGISGLVPGR